MEKVKIYKIINNNIVDSKKREIFLIYFLIYNNKRYKHDI